MLPPSRQVVRAMERKQAQSLLSKQKAHAHTTRIKGGGAQIKAPLPVIAEDPRPEKKPIKSRIAAAKRRLTGKELS